MEPDAAAKVRADGALVFPPVPDLPFDPYRGLLYSPDELFEGLADGRLRSDARRPRLRLVPARPRPTATFRLDAPLDPRRRGLRRPGRTPRRRPGRGRDGRARHGPRHGRLRGRRPPRPGPRPERAHRRDRRRPGRDGGRQPRRVRRAARRRDAGRGARTPRQDAPRSPRPSPTGPAPPSRCASRWPGGGDSVGIPTWFYGHEPPNAFAAPHRQVLRQRHPRGRPPRPLERGRRSSCPAPPAPSRRSSTTRPRTTTSPAANRPPWSSWTARTGPRRCPTWPLLQSLAAGRSMESRIALVDSVDEAPAALMSLTSGD